MNEMVKTILWAVVLSSVVLVMTARDEEQQKEWQHIIKICDETGQHCPKHLRGQNEY